MRCRLFLAAAGILLSSYGAMAQQAHPPVWVGGMLITGATGDGCAQANIQINELYTVVFHPLLSGDDVTVTTDVLQINQGGQKTYQIVPRGAVHFSTTGSYTATNWTGRATIKKFVGTYKNLVINPTPASDTQFINLSGVFNKVDAQACSITFAAGLTLKQ